MGLYLRKIKFWFVQNDNAMLSSFQNSHFTQQCNEHEFPYQYLFNMCSAFYGLL